MINCNVHNLLITQFTIPIITCYSISLSELQTIGILIPDPIKLSHCYIPLHDLTWIETSFRLYLRYRCMHLRRYTAYIATSPALASSWHFGRGMPAPAKSPEEVYHDLVSHAGPEFKPYRFGAIPPTHNLVDLRSLHGCPNGFVGYQHNAQQCY